MPLLAASRAQKSPATVEDAGVVAPVERRKITKGVNSLMFNNAPERSIKCQLAYPKKLASRHAPLLSLFGEALNGDGAAGEPPRLTRARRAAIAAA